MFPELGTVTRGITSVKWVDNRDYTQPQFINTTMIIVRTYSFVLTNTRFYRAACNADAVL